MSATCGSIACNKVRKQKILRCRTLKAARRTNSLVDCLLTLCRGKTNGDQRDAKYQFAQILHDWSRCYVSTKTERVKRVFRFPTYLNRSGGKEDMSVRQRSRRCTYGTWRPSIILRQTAAFRQFWYSALRTNSFNSVRRRQVREEEEEKDK